MSTKTTLELLCDLHIPSSIANKELLDIWVEFGVLPAGKYVLTREDNNLYYLYNAEADTSTFYDIHIVSQTLICVWLDTNKARLEFKEES